MTRPRWYYFRGWAWRVIRRPTADAPALEAWAVVRGDLHETPRTIVHVDPDATRHVAERQRAAVRLACAGIPPRPAPQHRAAEADA